MIPEELKAEFDRIFKETEKKIYGPSLEDMPFRIGPLQYAGLGDFRPVPENIKPSCLEFQPTLPTMDIQPVFDLVTGKLVDYKDIPVSTLSTDNPALVRPVTDIDDYLGGTGPNKQTKLQEQDFTTYLSALETGTNLLTTPFDEGVSEAETLEPLPDLPEIQASTEYRAPAETEKEEPISKPYKLDDWDTSQFQTEVPKPAYEFNFKCDNFQVRSMYRLEKNQMVFVSAPTSAGKTVVAQYAIALARQHKMRAIYTSPIKALSNQKYRDLNKVFHDVGILTGDVSLNRDASVLIMTTEILRLMLYRGADLLRDVDVVIFDECHYISDEERGVVWEESIILMPPHINMVFLSATIPNDTEIAAWIGRTKNRTVYVERHTERPVPLVHCLYAANDLAVLKQPGKTFDSQKFKRLENKFKEKQKRELFTPQYWQKAIDKFVNADLLPVLMFSFSQKNCNKFAKFAKQKCLIDDKQKAHVERFFTQSISRLKPNDCCLPQIEQVRSLLVNGIGLHHGGMLPILKECVEILLADGYVKVLFCTSTFAMGINVPARSCAFTSLEKFNGQEFVNLTPTEYVQMSGRAGRRGLDSQGHAILMVTKEFPEEAFIQKMFDGKVEKLNSQFYIRFNMILNLIRTQGMEMTDLMKRSLSSNTVQSAIPKKKEALAKVEEEIKNYKRADCALNAKLEPNFLEFNTDIEDSLDICGNYAEIIRKLQINAKHIKEKYGRDFKSKILQKGQLVFISEYGGEIAIIKNVTATNVELQTSLVSTLNVPFEKILIIFQNKVNSSVLMAQEKEKGLEVANYLKLFGSQDIDLHTMHTEIEDCWAFISKHPCFTCDIRSSHYPPSINQIENIEKKKRLDDEMDDEKLAFMPTLKSMINILKDHDYISQDNVIQIKGRVSIELSSANEFIATELLTNSFFDDLEPAEIAGIASCLVAQKAGNKEENFEIPDYFAEKVQFMQEIAQQLVDDFDNYQIDHQDDFVEYNVNPHAIMPVYQWASGADFIDIMQITLIPEGTLVRVIMMTNELLISLSKASKLIGNVDLVEKFEKASEAIRRDIIFAASLYLN